MSVLLDRIIGIYHFLGDRVPANAPLVKPRPRKINIWTKNGKPVVARVNAGGDIRQGLRRLVALLGGLDRMIGRGDRVFVKPNFNSADPNPASTDLAFFRAALEMVRETGAKITVGESSGGVWRPTRKVFELLGLPGMVKDLEIELVLYEERPGDWVKVEVEGEYLHRVAMPRQAYEADRLIYLPCMKTHFLAGFSGALKLAFGFVAPGQRRSFHLGHLQENLAEVNLCWQPDLIIMDGRKAFVTGGPNKGRVAEPGVMLASGDPVAVDIEAVRILADHGAHTLPGNPRDLAQISTALKYGLGAEGLVLESIDPAVAVPG